jgi:uncharacterized membrane protein YdjX (TVP38/TMEM64 family)
MPPLSLKTVLGVAAFVGVFMGVSAIAQTYEGVLGDVVRTGGGAAIVGFIALSAAFTVFIMPFDVSVLMPLAVAAWGPVPAAFMTVAGWSAGSAIAFALARRYGERLVTNVVGAKRLAEGRARTPHESVFWWALLIQALLPMDIVSYVFGLFTRIRLGPYLAATALGNLVPAFFFAYAGALPAWYQAGAFAFGLAVIALLFRRVPVRRP